MIRTRKKSIRTCNFFKGISLEVVELSHAFRWTVNDFDVYVSEVLMRRM